MKQTVKHILIYITVYLLALPCHAQHQPFEIKKKTLHPIQRTLISLGEIAGLNLFVWSYDRYVMNADFAHINMGTIRKNFDTGFVWDNDQLGTNFIMHPYHGALYFNAARSNGFSYFQSIPFTSFGSFMWECFLENEAPSINDFIATTAAGSMYGEIIYRLSGKVINNSSKGANRVFREILTGVISPTRELNRLITGEAWKYSKISSTDHTPVDFNLSAGVRWLQPEYNHPYSPYAQMSLRLVYNKEKKEIELPFDWFSLGLRFCAGQKSFYVNQMDITGVLWNRYYPQKNGSEWGFGIYQHFDYWDSPTHEYKKTPYRFAQVLALGPGVYYKNKKERKLQFNWEFYITGIGLGGALSDFYWVDMRDYNFGSGFSTDSKIKISAFNNSIRFNLSAGNYSLFTWAGYQKNRNLYDEKLNDLNVQGDEGYTNFTSIETEIGYWSNQYKWNISFSPEFINRHTKYKYHPSHNYSTWSFSINAGYTF